MPADHEAREQIVQVVNELYGHGLLTVTGGNVSARGADDETLWITPSKMHKGTLREADLVRIDRKGAVVEGSRAASIEWRMHFSSYDARPESTGAIHTHAPVATALGIVGLEIPPINTDAVLLRDTVTVPWILPGTQELADAVGEALAKSRGCILRNHGLMTVGPTLRNAATRAMILEETAKILLYVRQFGGEISLIPPDWIERVAKLEYF